ncbi:MFS transporter [Herbaspirillum sp.]|uniref:MFS transporter n=1 Tax=Herbaspirillum sp. TaxID=1890675 RepID=UPI0031D205F3
MTSDADVVASRWISMLLVSTLVVLSAVPMDVLLPSYPSLAIFFDVEVNKISFSITVFTVGFSIAQLIVGPISDRYGRKKCVVVGLLIALIGAMGCAFSERYIAFLSWRVVQSVGCACFVLAQAIVQDCYKGGAGIRARIYLTTLGGMAIACSPLLGTVLEHVAGWRGSFFLFVCISLIAIFLAIRYFVETAASSVNTVGFYIGSYLKIWRNFPFLVYTIMGGMAFSSHFAFVIASPLLFMTEMKVGTYSYAWILLVYGGAYLFGGICAVKIAKRFSPAIQIWAGLVLMILSSMVMLISERTQGATVSSVLLAMLVCTAGASIVRPATGTLAMDIFDDLAGTASAAGATIRFAMGGMFGAVVSLQGSAVSKNLAWMILASGVISVITFVIFNLWQRRCHITLSSSK